jgi:hypothetical protein
LVSWLQAFHFALSWDHFCFAAFHCFLVQFSALAAVEGSDEVCVFNAGFGAGAVDCERATPQVRLAANAATVRERQGRDMAALLDKPTFPLV